MANVPSAVDFWLWPLRLGLGLTQAAAKRDVIDWTSDNEIIAVLPTMRLRRFASARADRPVLIAAPYAVHDAGIVDVAHGHSLVEALAACGLGPIYVTEWLSATRENAHRTVDCHLVDLNAAVDLAGAPASIVGLCQGGWLSLVYAAAFPAKVRRLAAIGAPVDVSNGSAVTEGARRILPELLEEMIAVNGGIVSGASTLAAFRGSDGAETDAREILQVDPAAASEALARFAAWDNRPIDLPGRYYVDVLNWIFRENRLAAGDFPVFGRPLPLSAVVAPLYVLAGARDAIAPPTQALAATTLVGTPAEAVRSRIADCGHLALFMGARTLVEDWPEIADWLKA